jgi:predicted DNA-binding transcriptional regulator AlpA
MTGDTMNTSLIENTTERHYSVNTLAELLGIRRASVWRWVRAGEAPALHRIGPGTTRGRSSEWNPFLADPAAWRAAHRCEAREPVAA